MYFNCKLKNNLDRTCFLIGLQVCFHSAMKHENDQQELYCWLSPNCENLQFHERKKTIHLNFVFCISLCQVEK